MSINSWVQWCAPVIPAYVDGEIERIVIHKTPFLWEKTGLGGTHLVGTLVPVISDRVGIK
jgi:hypothetical protein